MPRRPGGLPVRPDPTQAIEYSYLTFPPLAKSYGVEDVFFPLETMHHDGAVFSFDIDIHYIHATFGLNVTAGFAGGAAEPRRLGADERRAADR